MTVEEIVIEYLKKNGFDGLYCVGECGCEISDLMPCNEAIEHCEAGYKQPCDPETCNLDGDCDWHIGREKPNVGAEVPGEGEEK